MDSSNNLEVAKLAEYYASKWLESAKMMENADLVPLIWHQARVLYFAFWHEVAGLSRKMVLSKYHADVSLNGMQTRAIYEHYHESPDYRLREAAPMLRIVVMQCAGEARELEKALSGDDMSSAFEAMGKLTEKLQLLNLGTSQKTSIKLKISRSTAYKKPELANA